MAALRAVELASPATPRGTVSLPAARTRPNARRTARLIRRQAIVDPDVRRAHKGLRRNLVAFVAGGDLPTLLSALPLYSLVVPVALLDAWVTLYQAICFRAWGLQRVRRRPYLVFDRQKLAYLNGVEKLNCLYCGYANGVIAYVREVAGRTEQYWCPIRHGRSVRDPHRHYASFVPYGDAEAYRRELPALRQALATTPHGAPRRNWSTRS